MHVYQQPHAHLSSFPNQYIGIKKIVFGSVLLCGLICGNATAFPKIVYDPIAVGKQLDEFREQSNRWKETAENYRKQLVSLGGMSFAYTDLTQQNKGITGVDPDYGLADACRKKNSDGAIGSISSLFTPSADSEILEQQHEICKRIVRAENLKYNETVTFLNNLKKRQRELGNLDGRRTNDIRGEQGAMQALQYDIQRYQQNSKMDLDNWQAMMTAYDGYIGQLNKYQQRLANRALRGKQPDIFSGIIQGAVLKGALKKRRSEYAEEQLEREKKAP